MTADWLFDDAGVAEQLRSWADAASSALQQARLAVERAEHDALTDADQAALVEAFDHVQRMRAALRAIDGELLADADDLLSDLIAIARSANQRLQVSA